MGSKGRAVLLVAVLVTNRRETLFFSIRVESKVAEYWYLGRDTVSCLLWVLSGKGVSCFIFTLLVPLLWLRWSESQQAYLLKIPNSVYQNSECLALQTNISDMLKKNPFTV